MQILEAILVAAILVVPVAVAMQLTDGFERMMLLSVGIGEISVVAGIGLSYAWQIATGPMIVLTAVAIYLGSIAFAAR